MTIPFSFLLIIGAVIALVYTLRKIRNAEISIAESTFWFVFVVCLVFMAICRQAVFFLSDLLGIQSPANFVFLFILTVLLIKNFFTSVEISKLKKKMNTLIQEEALKNVDNIESMNSNDIKQ